MYVLSFKEKIITELQSLWSRMSN
ncbi:hypothetical protein QQP08_023805 [Theobroma cacao]|nr:hypothetical protein QQP08_023805 [Theobroma cacao]